MGKQKPIVSMQHYDRGEETLLAGDNQDDYYIDIHYASKVRKLVKRQLTTCKISFISPVDSVTMILYDTEMTQSWDWRVEDMKAIKLKWYE